ncbi:MAG: hypothetical protein NVS3B26_11380 [Mycobacteriales bacterium]
MGATPELGLARLREAASQGELDPLCHRYAVRIRTVFGSAVRAGPVPRDLDIAVRFEPSSSGDTLGLLDALSRLTGSDDIDLMVLDAAGPVARERALVGCLALYESQTSAFADAQMLSICKRMDSDWLRALDLETLRR